MPAGSLDDLFDRIEAEARKGGMSLDAAVYESAGRDSCVPIVFAGSLDAPMAVMGRDLGGKEVKYGEPLIGDAGRRVRSAVYEAVTSQHPSATDTRLPVALSHVLLTNTVPYKPVGNKAYPGSVRERFRPFVEEFLVYHWRGDLIITLGTEAFKWFAPYAADGAAESFWARTDRYEAEFPCVLTATAHGKITSKPVTVGPLPHPSPLNRTHWTAFPAMLSARLARLDFTG